MFLLQFLYGEREMDVPFVIIMDIFYLYAAILVNNVININLEKEYILREDYIGLLYCWKYCVEDDSYNFYFDGLRLYSGNKRYR